MKAGRQPAGISYWGRLCQKDA